MKQLCIALVLFFALPAWAGLAQPHKAVAKTTAKASAKGSAKASGKVSAKSLGKTAHVEHKGGKSAQKPPGKPPKVVQQPTPAAPSVNEITKPAAGDPDRARIVRLQEALDSIVRGKVLGHLRVGMRVEDLASGRALYSWRSSALMDPASNQKVLSTTAALLRLGATFRYRTEVTGAQPDGEGSVAGSLVIRGSGDPSLRPRHIEALAQSLVARGVTRVSGDILADPRRIGSDEPTPGGRAPLRVGSSEIEVHIRPGDKVGSRPTVSIRPASDVFVVVNQAETRAKGKAHLGLAIERAGQRFQVVVSGKISMAKGEVVMHRAPSSQPLFVALVLRHALIQAGIDVHGGVGVYSGEGRGRVSSLHALDGAMVAFSAPNSDSSPPLAQREVTESRELLALHESEPLALLLRRVNKDSDNEWAERVLETVGAEVLGGAPTTAKGVHILRESLAELGLPTTAFSPANGSGLGHHNRITAAGMDDLLRRIYFDPRIGPEMLQSLSVGGVDGTTRNRFRGTSAAHRVRAKTGTLTGVSCLSGYVGDGSDVLVFSILVEGLRKRALTNVRATQVSAVNAMMRFARHIEGALPVEEGPAGTDLETDNEVDEGEGDNLDGTESSEPEHASETAP